MEQIVFFKDLCRVLDTRQGSLVAGTKAAGVLDTLAGCWPGWRCRWGGKKWVRAVGPAAQVTWGLTGFGGGGGERSENQLRFRDCPSPRKKKILDQYAEQNIKQTHTPNGRVCLGFGTMGDGRT